MPQRLTRLTAKGQLTIPVEIRKDLNLKPGDYLAVSSKEGQIIVQKATTITPLSESDPIWKMIGTGESNSYDVSEKHDLHLAEGEIKSWDKE
ncbi:MAG: AbrB/MazE/SpoVT family DNA-binding domain-containing protein [Bacillota bacterium]|nr:AbrB/MazE/SpoVT family DNA-binding domain-containing protein [Bacillota bacterium]MDW7682679.1 AbrB/MazE/SpoVT family DNA-binding domain-containing protein [Bacillota bacterium]